MDFDGDGILDLISGSYDPGDLYLFPGLGKGKYAKRKTLVDVNDVPLVHHPDELKRYHALQGKAKTDDEKEAEIQARMASFGSWPAMVDWDDDGDLDLLIGSFGGRIYLRMNEGLRAAPRFAGATIELKADGNPLEVHHHANPVIADWDDDGLWDLVVGSGDGSVVWFRNLGSKGKPLFGPSRTLVPACAEDIFLTQYLKPGEEPGQGPRAQICVVDYDLDGGLDLLVGDYSSVARQRADLDDDALAQLAGILAEEQAIRAKPTTDEEPLAKDEALTKDDKLPKQQKLAKLEEAKSRFFKVDPAPHSFVWLYRRK